MPTSSYPRAAGLPELREAIVDVGPAAVRRDARSGDRPDPDARQQGADLLARAGGARSGIGTGSRRRDGARVHDPRARRSVRRGRRRCDCRSRRPTSCPDLDGVGTDTWDRTAILWLNYPNNPTGAVAPLAFLERAADARAPSRLPARARRGVQRGLVRRRTSRVGAASSHDRTNVVVLNTLSKRSNMTGYRSGFMAGDPRLIAAMKALRPSTGVTPQEFVQRASVAAWRDEIARAGAARALRRQARASSWSSSRAKGVEVAGSVAGMYLWVAVPGGRPSLAWALELLELGIVVAPGSFFGPEGEGYVRMAMVPTLEDCGAPSSPRGRPVRSRGARVSVGRHADLAARIEASFDAEDWESTPPRSRKRSGCSTAARSASPSRRTPAGS